MSCMAVRATVVSLHRRQAQVERISRAEVGLEWNASRFGVSGGVEHILYEWEYGWVRPSRENAFVIDKGFEMTQNGGVCALNAIRLVSVHQAEAMMNAKPASEIFQ